MLKHKSILIYDIETDGLDITTSKMKWFGAYSYIDDKFYLLPYTKQKEIQLLLDRHRVFVGFNNKGFDDPIIENNGYGKGNYKITIDLLEMSAQKGTSEYNKNFKNKLIQMGIEINKFTLKNIIEVLKLDQINKGDINYTIFQKDNWSNDEEKEIKKYLKQDLVLTKKLFEWYEKQFQPLKELLPKNAQRNYKHLTTSLASLAYTIMCHRSGLELEWGEREDKTEGSFSGGHHIEPRFSKVKGNIVNIDFTSAYPHALIMGNLYSPCEEGWNGGTYFNIKGTYNNTEQGVIEKSLQELFIIRLKAKKENDKIKSQAYKICINSQYGLTGNPIFKTFYNPTTASDCTHIVRTWLKKLAKTIEEHGFKVLYGFTDNIIIQIPDPKTEDELMYVVNKFIKEVKENMPFPLDTFGMELETRMKFIWFVSKNCYLWINNKNEIKYKSTLLNKNTPLIIMNIFNEYISKKILEELDVSFTEEELRKQVLERIAENIKSVATEHKVGDLQSYKVKTSLQYQISLKYGEGMHFLIPNIKGIGIGKAKTTKKKIGVRYCTEKEFNENKLTVKDVDVSQLMLHLKPFITKSNQQQLKTD